jgi:pimeloyl-ACP methyl ester carboxylesterase
MVDLAGVRRALAALAILGALGVRAAEAPAPDALRAEARRRSDALVKAGFNMTYGWSLDVPRDGRPQRVGFLVPPSDEEDVFHVWWEAGAGEASLRLVFPDGTTVMQWAGRTGDVTLSRRFLPGAYVLEVDSSRAKGGEALLGIRGPVVAACTTEDRRVEEIPADPSKSFHWPYLLVLPKEVHGRHVLVVPNNPGFATENLDLLRASAFCEVARQLPLVRRLGVPLLVPLFPRPAVAGEEDDLYLHALTRAALTTDVPAWRRVDLQLLAMLDDARARLTARGIGTDTKVFLRGFSASGSFVSRFALLHPERVKAVACGSPGGWPLAPASADGGEALAYPVGVGDLQALVGRRMDLKAARSVSFFYFLGAEDKNDAVPFRDSFSNADETLVFRRFGATPVARWKEAERLYAAAGLDARFALYPGVGHEVTPAMDADVARFFEGTLGRTPSR